MAASLDCDSTEMEFLRPEHSEEMEVLLAIYDGDVNFKAVNGHSIQYKIGENEEPLSILVEIQWTQGYPESVPNISMDSFYNQHLSLAAKRGAIELILKEAWKNVGDHQTYGLIEWMKENILQIIGPYVFDEMCRIENREKGGNDEVPEADTDKPAKESRKEQLTKAQKRREWDRVGKDGKSQRGHDWVDVVRHLSQTGGGQGGSAGATGGAPAAAESSKSSSQ